MISFLLARKTTFLIPCANARVDDDSETAPAAGESVQMTEIRASPDSDGCSKRVLRPSAIVLDPKRVAHSLLSRYGICPGTLRRADSPSLEMTSLRVSRLASVSIGRNR